MKALLSLFLAACASIHAADTLQLTLGPGFTPAQQAVCARVQALYGEKLVADRGLPAPFSLMGITIRIVPIDGAPPTPNVWAQSYGGTWRGNADGKYVFDGAGRIDVDSANLPAWSDEVLGWVLVHEAAHFYAFAGPIWELNGNMPVVGQYTGPRALAAYRAEIDPLAAWVPVDESHFAQALSPMILTPYLSGSYVSMTFLGVLADNGNELTKWAANFTGGPLASILPRRSLRPVIVLQ